LFLCQQLSAFTGVVSTTPRLYLQQGLYMMSFFRTATSYIVDQAAPAFTKGAKRVMPQAAQAYKSAKQGVETIANNPQLRQTISDGWARDAQAKAFVGKVYQQFVSPEAPSATAPYHFRLETLKNKAQQAAMHVINLNSDPNIPTTRWERLQATYGDLRAKGLPQEAKVQSFIDELTTTWRQHVGFTVKPQPGSDAVPTEVIPKRSFNLSWPKPRPQPPTTTTINTTAVTVKPPQQPGLNMPSPNLDRGVPSSAKAVVTSPPAKNVTFDAPAASLQPPAEREFIPAFRPFSVRPADTALETSTLAPVPTTGPEASGKISINGLENLNVVDSTGKTVGLLRNGQLRPANLRSQGPQPEAKSPIPPSSALLVQDPVTEETSEQLAKRIELDSANVKTQITSSQRADIPQSTKPPEAVTPSPTVTNQTTQTPPTTEIRPSGMSEFDDGWADSFAGSGNLPVQQNVTLGLPSPPTPGKPPTPGPKSRFQQQPLPPASSQGTAALKDE
jgi:hypothetical protein